MTSRSRPEKRRIMKKVICSMSAWVSERKTEKKGNIVHLHSKEESLNMSSQWPWGSLVLCQNFWLDVMQRLSAATSAGKMLEWWSKMCWHRYWQRVHAGGYSVRNGRGIISPDRSFIRLSNMMQKIPWAIMDTGHSQFSWLHTISPKRRSGDSQRVLQSSPSLPLITYRWASLMPVYISAA